MLVKIFAQREGYFRTIVKASSMLEEDVNAWLRANAGIKVTDITQSSCGGSMEPSKTFISVWYEPEATEVVEG